MKLLRRNIHIILCIMIFFILIFINNEVMALWLGQKNITVNVTRGLGGTDFNVSDPQTNAFCIQNKQPLNDYRVDGELFRVVRDVHITGDIAKWKSITGASRTVRSDLNVKMGWIISQENTGSDHILMHYSEKQKSIYQIFGQWSNAIGMSEGLAINGGGYTSNWVNEANKFYNTWKKQKNAFIVNGTPNLKGMNKEIYYDKETNREYIKIGPINLTYNEKYINKGVYDQNERAINAQYAKYEGGKLKIYDKINNASISGQDFYIMIDTSINDISSIKFKATVESNINDIDAKLWVLQAQSGNPKQNLIVVEGGIYNRKTYANIEFGPIEVLGNLKIKKIDEDSQKPLNKVGFKLYCKNKNEYVEKADGVHAAKYTKDKNKAQEFFTNSNGEVEIKKLIMGNYTIFETKNPNQGYEEITTPVEVKEIELKSVINKTTITNKRKYVDLSGIIWEDIGDGKQTYRNNLYGKEDILVSGMTVKLLEQGKEIKSVKTGQNGKYIFKNVEIDKLSKCYVSFKYNGMSYECVPKTLNKTNGSKAIEGVEREKFNNKFVEIQKQQAIGNKGEKTPIEYNNGSYESIINLGKKEQNGKKPYYGVYSKYEITSNTYNSYNGYLDKIRTPAEIRKKDIKEISNLNLGIFLREQPNASLIKDLNNVKISIQGQTHTYNYRERYNNPSIYTEGKGLLGLTPQIKFQGKYSGMSYTRPLYASDISYDGTEELNIRVIYEIGLINKSSNLKTKITKLNDYYDSKYILKSVGKTLTKEGYVNNDKSIKVTKKGNKNNYEEIELSTNIIIEPQRQEKLYLEFEITRDKLVNIINQNANIKLDNVAEIGGYATLDSKGKAYAGIDSNSQPGSTNPMDLKTYEDDTDKAPGLSLILQKDPRKISGKVFLDKIETPKDPNKIMTKEERKGNGRYDNGENGIKEVEVKLVYANNPNEIVKIYDESTKTLTKEAKVKTNSNGDFEISGFIPGDYELKYTWGDKEYKVQNYKGTAIDENIWNANKKNKEWYKNTEPRYSDSIDEYETRKKIDNQTRKITNENIKVINNYVEGTKVTLQNGDKQTLITKMDSRTQDFKVNIEYNKNQSNIKDEFATNKDESIKLDSKGNPIIKDEFKNIIRNMDFGIVERPRQELKIEKHIKQVKIILANGMVLVDAEVEKTLDGKYQLKSNIQHTVYIPKSNATEGTLKMEIDQELIEGAKLEVIYEISINNTGEIDYISESYYKFGKKDGNIVELTPSNIIDYLDDSLVIADSDTLNKWNKLTLDERKKLIEKGTLDKELQKYVEKLKTVLSYINNTKLKPGEESKLELTATKLLSKNDETILSNKTEIIEITKTGGRPPIPIPGNYNPEKYQPKEPDENSSEEIIIIPPTGKIEYNMYYVVLGISILGILMAGIILIKKLVLKNNK